MKKANNERKKRKDIEQKIERLFTYKRFNPQLISDKGDTFFKDQLRKYFQTTKFAKDYVAWEDIKAYDIDFVLREDHLSRYS